MCSLIRILLVLALCSPVLRAQWQRSAVPFEATAVASSGTMFWICGADSGIASSSDGGLHWEVRNQKANGGKLLSRGVGAAKGGDAGGGHAGVALRAASG